MAPQRHRPHGAPSSTSTRDCVGIKTYHRRRPATAVEIAQRLFSLATSSVPTGCLAPVTPISPIQGLTPPLGSGSAPSSHMSQTPRVCCPWSFLDISSSSKCPEPLAKTTPSFAFIVGHSVATDDLLSKLPIPEVRGDKTFVRISEDLYQEQLKMFRTNLIGRLLLRKGSFPLRTADIKSSLAAIWKPTEPWRLVPLGKGFFDIHFESEEDMKRIQKGGSCTVATGIFRLSDWKPDFKPGDALPQTHSQVWIRISGLSQDYWHPRHLMEIASGVGTPIHIDNSTRERHFGYYARILVDIDLSQDHPTTLMVERGTHAFSVSIDYETSLANLKHVVAKDKPRVKSAHYRAKSPTVTTPKSRSIDLGDQFAILETVPDNIVANVDVGVVFPLVEERIEGSSLCGNINITKELISPVLDLRNQFTILNTSIDNDVDGVVVPLVEDHTNGSSLSGNRDITKGVTMSSSDPGGLIADNDIVQHIPSLATSSQVVKTNFCWGDLENDEPLKTPSDINYADITSANSWYEEGEAPLDREILRTVSKTHPKNLKSNQIQTAKLDRYPKRVRTPTVRLNI